MSINEDLEDRLRDITATVLGVEADLLSGSSSPETVPAWTSLRHLALIAAIEEEFSIQFSLAEIHSAQRFGDLQRILMERTTQQSGRV
jgi:acyl carrier protein